MAVYGLPSRSSHLSLLLIRSRSQPREIALPDIFSCEYLAGCDFSLVVFVVCVCARVVVVVSSGLPPVSLSHFEFSRPRAHAQERVVSVAIGRSTGTRARWYSTVFRRGQGALSLSLSLSNSPSGESRK